MAVVATATREIPVTEAGKGHVPEESLDRYRSLARHARQLTILSNALDIQGEFADGGLMHELSQKYWGMANDLRVDL